MFPGRCCSRRMAEVLAIDKQEIETQVEVKSGETIALGGIFHIRINPQPTACRC